MTIQLQMASTEIQPTVITSQVSAQGSMPGLRGRCQRQGSQGGGQWLSAGWRGAAANRRLGGAGREASELGWGLGTSGGFEVGSASNLVYNGRIPGKAQRQGGPGGLRVESGPLGAPGP